MPYARIYTRQEVHQLLYESEGRASPFSGAAGHTLALHADMRQDVTDQRPTRTLHLAQTIEQSRAMDPAAGETITPGNPPGIDGRFTSRMAIICAVTEGLNSAQGQARLAELDANPGIIRRVINAPLATPIPNCERFTLATGTHDRNLTAHGVRIIVDRLSPPPECGIHLQTAFPQNLH